MLLSPPFGGEGKTYGHSLEVLNAAKGVRKKVH